jgi:tRNA(adenine34) deaminase
MHDINLERSRHEKFMSLTLDLAKRSLMAGELPIGAIVVLENAVVAEAYCSDKRRRMLEHPELLALIAADMKTPSVQKRRRMTLYTNLEPCMMCLGAAMSFCVGGIVYGVAAPADGAVMRLAEVSFGNATYPEYEMPAIVGGVMRDESRSLFRAFIEKSTDDSMVTFARGILGADSDDQLTVSAHSLCSEP